MHAFGLWEEVKVPKGGTGKIPQILSHWVHFSALEAPLWFEVTSLIPAHTGDSQEIM